MIKFINRISLSLLALSCSQGQQSSSSAIIGQNDLESESEVFLNEVVGRLSDGRVDCTAFVSGTDEIATVAHCVEKLDLQKSKFYTRDFKNGLNTKVSNLDESKDFAVLKVGATFKKTLTFGDLFADDASIVVYDIKSNSLMVDKSCTVKRDKNYPGLLIHTCDSLPGMSGSPILQKGKVVGIHLGSLPYYKNLNAALEVSRRFDKSIKVNRSFIEDEFLPSFPKFPGGGHCVPWCPGDNPLGPVSDGISETGKVLADGITHTWKVSTGVSEKIVKGGEKVFTGVVENLPWLKEAMVAAYFLVNGAMCIESLGASPGVAAPTSEGTAFCSANACGCTMLMAYFIAKRNFELDANTTSKISNIINHQNFQNAETEYRRETLLAVTGAIPHGYFFDKDGIGVFWSNGNDAYCWITHPKYVEAPPYKYLNGIDPHKMTKMRRDGACPGQT